MELYKRRDFGQMFSDTFAFLKANGGHYFKNYFAFIAIPLLIFGIAAYFFFRYYLLVMEYTTTDFQGNVQAISNGEMLGLGISSMAFFVVAVVFAILNQSYTALYMMLYNEHGKQFTSRDIIANFKIKMGRIFKFTLALILTSIIIAVPLVIVSVVLTVTVIGILFVPLLFGFVYLWYNSAFLEYISTTSGSIMSITFSFNLIKDHFWKSVGCLTIMYIILYLVTSIITGVPFYIYIFSQAITNINETNFPVNDFFGAIILFYVGSMILQIFANLIIQSNANIIYYSLIEKESNISAFEEIDQIGSHIEY